MIGIVVPFLSKRKTASHQEDVRYEQVTTIHPNMAYPAAKVSRVANRSYPEHDFFNDAFVKILGFPIGTVSVTNGNRSFARSHRREHHRIVKVADDLFYARDASRRDARGFALLLAKDHTPEVYLAFVDDHLPSR